MPSPWVTRALRSELPLTERYTGESRSSGEAGADIRRFERDQRESRHIAAALKGRMCGCGCVERRVNVGWQDR